MFSIRDIIATNAGTFYNYRTNSKESPIARYASIIAIAIAISLIFGKIHDDLYTGLIAVQSILVGFAFNVLFYLSANPIKINDDAVALENNAKAVKLNKLGNEVFYNISYFNLVSILSISFACFMLLLNAFQPIQIKFPDILIHKLDVAKIKSTCEILVNLLLRILVAVTFICTLESLATFARIVKRMTYLFRERMVLERRS